MAAEFLDSIQLYDEEQGTTLTIEHLNDQELLVSMKPDLGDVADLVLSRGDAVILAERLRRLALATKYNLASDDTHPDL